MTGMPDSPLRSRLALWTCLLALLLFACALHREVLFGGEVYHMDDAADGYYPGHIAVARAFAAGELPTWERGSWCGWPLVVDPYNGVFYPLNVIYYVVGAARGLGYAIALHAWLGGVGMLLFLRRRRLSFWTALLGALSYEMSSFGVVRIRHVIFVQMFAWLPWILWGVERFVVTRRRRDLALVAGATGMALVAGALSIGHFAALAIAGYTLARCVPVAGTPDRLRRFSIDAGLLAAAALLGALLAAAQILPTVAHLPYSPRSLGSDYRFASSYAWPDLSYFWTLAAPNLYGGEDRAGYHGVPNHWELCGYYAGVVSFVLATVGLFARRRRGAELYVLFALVVLAIGIALGDVGPVHRFFYRHLPLYAALRCPARALLIAVMALPILGAHGAQVLLDRAPDWSSRGAKISGAGIALALGLCALGLLHAHGPLWVRTVTRMAGGHSYSDKVPFAALYDADAIRHAIAIGLGLLGVVALRLFSTLPARAIGLLLVLLSAGDQLSIDRGYIALYHKPADHPVGMERFAAVDWIVKNGGPPWQGRVVNDPRGPFRLHNIGMVLGLESASGYDSVAVWRYVELLHLLRYGHRYPYRELRDDFAAIGVWNLDSRLLDLMNVRWLLAGERPGPRWIERFRPSGKEGGPAAKWEPYWNANMKVFENGAVLPRAFVAHRAEVPGGDDLLAKRIIAPDFDPGRVALLEEAPGIALPNGVNLPPTAARMVAVERTHLVIESDDPQPGILILSEVDYPGWSVTVDGQRQKLLRADWAFRGVALPAGHHRIEMRYRSRPIEVGIVLSLLALLGALALALTDRWVTPPVGDTAGGASPA